MKLLTYSERDHVTQNYQQNKMIGFQTSLLSVVPSSPSEKYWGSPSGSKKGVGFQRLNSSLRVDKDLDPTLFKDKQIQADFCLNTDVGSLNQASVFEEPLDLESLLALTQLLQKEPHERFEKNLVDVLALISKVPIFRDLILNTEPASQSDFNHLSKFVTHQYFKRGEQVFQAGEKAQKMYIILQGKVSVYRESKGRSFGRLQTLMRRKESLIMPVQMIEEHEQGTPSSIATFEGAPCKLFITEDEYNTQGVRVKSHKKPHPVYKHIRAGQEVYDGFAAEPLETEGFKHSLDNFINARYLEVQSELDFKAKCAMIKEMRKKAIALSEASSKRSVDSATGRPIPILMMPVAKLTMLSQVKESSREEVLKITDEGYQESKNSNDQKEICDSDSDFGSSQSFGSMGTKSEKGAIPLVILKPLLLDNNKITSNSDSGHRMVEQRNIQGPSTTSVGTIDDKTQTSKDLSDSDESIDEDLMVRYFLRDDLPHQDCLTELGSGHYFGMMALDDQLMNRAATVYAKKGCHLLVISRPAFLKMTQFNTRRRAAELMAFLRQIPLLQSFNNIHLKKLTSFLEPPLKKTLNAYIYKEGEPALFVYIVKSGSFRVTIKKPKQTTGKQMNSLRSQAGSYDLVELQMISSEQVIGEEDCFLSGKYTTTVQCVSQHALLLRMSRADFWKLKQFDHQWRQIGHHAHNKAQRYNDAIRHSVCTRQNLNQEMLMVGDDAHVQDIEEVVIKHYRHSAKIVKRSLSRGPSLSIDYQSMINTRVQTRPRSSVKHTDLQSFQPLSSAQSQKFISVQPSGLTTVRHPKPPTAPISLARTTQKIKIQKKITNLLEGMHAEFNKSELPKLVPSQLQMTPMKLEKAQSVKSIIKPHLVGVKLSKLASAKQDDKVVKILQQVRSAPRLETPLFGMQETKKVQLTTQYSTTFNYNKRRLEQKKTLCLPTPLTLLNLI